MGIGYSPKLPLQHDPVDGYYKLNKTIGAVMKQNIKMVVLTCPGERMMDPNFGVGVRNYLFDTKMVTHTSLRGKIMEQVKKYVPFVRVTDINVIDLQDNPGENEPTNSLGLQIHYTIPSVGLDDTLAITFAA
jgi:hypothetical protein